MFLRVLHHHLSGASILSLNQTRLLFRSSGLLGRLLQFKLSDIGEGIAEVQVKEWYVKVGDEVSQFDNICDVQSDKASVTITSRYDGIIRKLCHDVEAIARVGDPLIEIEVEDEEDGADETSDSSSSSEDESHHISAAQAPAQAVPAQRSRPAQAAIIAGDSIGDAKWVAHTDADAAVRAPPIATAKALATPAVRRIAKENKVNLAEVPSSGKGGRVLKEDILRYIGHIKEEKPEPYERPDAMPRPEFLHGEDRTIPIRGYMRAMIKTMSQATTIPHFCYCDEICVDRLVDLRGQLQEIAKEKQIKMSYMPLFIKAASLALHNYPIINASLDKDSQNITLKAAHNICVAMDTPDGLVVPNIKHCETKSLWEIGFELSRLQVAARDGRLSMDDLTDGTFTLSNIGTIGGTYAAPVILVPQVCIGALGSIHVLPRYDKQGNIAPTHIVKASWSADHRVIDGATMARFSNVWKRYLEHPALMIAEMK